MLNRALWQGFVESARRFPRRPALLIGGRSYAYAELNGSARRIAATLQQSRASAEPPLTAVFAERGATAFAAILGVLMGGRGYVPLSPGGPRDRLREMFRQSGCRSVVVDGAGLSQLDALLEGAPPTLVLAPEIADMEELSKRWPEHRFFGANALAEPETWTPPPIDSDALAYIVFTSGSTGVPKGVMVAHRNAAAFVDYMADFYQVNETDRFSQMSHPSFDLSVFDMFVCLERGACLCCPSAKGILNPGRFIAESELTVWSSVPSTVAFMRQFGMLKSGAYPSLRLSLFCGEPLPATAAADWAKAAPNSEIENTYGPTEVTVACTRFRWNEAVPQDHCELGIVPIGEVFPGMTALVVDETLREVEPGETGELLMSGPQVTLGYLGDAEKTTVAFVTVPGHEGVFYRTGDRVRRPVGERPMTHLGRLDFQIKVRGGYRVELGEVEAAVREESGLTGVVAVGWPPAETGFGGLEVFVEGSVDPAALLGRLAARLPDHMTPRRIHSLHMLPRTSSDKFDRQAIRHLLEEGEGLKAKRANACRQDRRPKNRVDRDMEFDS